MSAGTSLPMLLTLQLDLSSHAQQRSIELILVGMAVRARVAKPSTITIWALEMSPMQAES